MSEFVRGDAVEVDRPLRDKLTDAIERLPPENVPLSVALDLIGREGLLVLCVFLVLPFMVPISIPGVSTVFGACILLIGLSVMLKRKLWLPDRLMNRTVPTGRLRMALEKGSVWLKRVEGLSRPRWRVLAHGPVMTRFNGFKLVIAALLLMAPLGLVPLSNTLPGIAILFLSVGILQRDGGLILLGYVTNIVTIGYFTAVIWSGGHAAREVIEHIGGVFT